MGIAWQPCAKCGVNFSVPANSVGPLRCPECGEAVSPQFEAEPEPQTPAPPEAKAAPEAAWGGYLPLDPKMAWQATWTAPDEHPASCPHRADVLWLAGRLRRSEHEVGKLRHQRHQLECRLRKAKRRGKR